jgi:hypothetical protein
MIHLSERWQAYWWWLVIPQAVNKMEGNQSTYEQTETHMSQQATACLQLWPKLEQI